MSDNLERSFGKLAAHSPTGTTRQFGSVTAVSVGVPTPVFNRVFVFESPSKEELTSAMMWLTERDDPFWVTAEASLADDVVAAAGDFDIEMSDDVQPGMALEPLREIQPDKSVADVDVVADTDALDEWSAVGEGVFDFSSETTSRLTSASVLEDDEMRMFVGRVDGRQVACGLLVQTGDVAGVYTIGVDEEFRQRGIGEAMTWEVLRTGRELGCQVGVLQSSEMGVPLYERMGFETVVGYRHWRLDN